MEDALIDKVHLGRGVEEVKEFNKLLAGGFEDLLRVARFVLKNNVPEGIRAVPTLGRVRLDLPD